MSAREEMLVLARWALDGEVFGEAMFAALRDRCSDRDRRADLESLRVLEVQTGEMLRGFLTRQGAETDVDPGAARRGSEGGARLADAGWDETLRILAGAIDPTLARYRRLVEIVPDPERATMAGLIAHEEAIRAYVDAAIAGAADPGHVVRRLLSSARHRRC